MESRWNIFNSDGSRYIAHVIVMVINIIIIIIVINIVFVLVVIITTGRHCHRRFHITKKKLVKLVRWFHHCHSLIRTSIFRSYIHQGFSMWPRTKSASKNCSVLPAKTVVPQSSTSRLLWPFGHSPWAPHRLFQHIVQFRLNEICLLRGSLFRPQTNVIYAINWRPV